MSFSVYMKLKKCDLLKKASQKCEQFSYDIFGGIFLRFWVLNGPLTKMKPGIVQAKRIQSYLTEKV